MDLVLIGFVGLWVAVAFSGIYLIKREQAKNKKELEYWKQKLLEVNGKDKDSPDA